MTYLRRCRTQRQRNNVILCLVLLAIVVIVLPGCSAEEQADVSSPTPESLSLNSDEERAMAILPWSEIAQTCAGIDSDEPIGGFGRSGETVEIASGETMEISESDGEAWVYSRFLRDGSPNTDDFRSFSVSVAFLKDEGFGASQLETLDQWDYEKSVEGTTTIAKSPKSLDAGSQGMSSSQVFLIDGSVMAHLIGMNSTGVQPYCTEVEIDNLIDVLSDRIS